MSNGTSEQASIDFGEETVTGDLLWEADFSNPEEFQVESESGPVKFQGNELFIDCTKNSDGVTVWIQQEFPENVLIECTATCGEEGDRMEITSGRNLNLFFAATGVDGEAETLAETERSGDYTEYHDLPNYIFTFTLYHSRMRRDPGFEKRSEFLVGSQPNHGYKIQILKREGDIAASIDDRLVHDWNDSDALGSGWVGLRTWNTQLTVHDWAVYEPHS